MVVEPTFGIDARGEHLLSARVESRQGRPFVAALSTYEPNDTDNPSESRRLQTIADHKVQYKRFKLNPTADVSVESAVRFELSQMLLESPTLFDLQFAPLNQNHWYLGIISRLETIAKSHFAPAEPSDGNPTGWLARAVAVGRGYLAFCRQASDGFRCVVDVAPGGASICYLHNKQLVDVNSLEIPVNNLHGPAQVEQMAVDLKTVVSYQLGVISDRGFGLPLSGLVLFGDGIDDQTREIVNRYFPVPLASPLLNPAFFDDGLLERTAHPERYLAALGLAVN